MSDAQYVIKLHLHGASDAIEAFKKRHIRFVRDSSSGAFRASMDFVSVLTPPKCLRLPISAVGDAKAIHEGPLRVVSDVLFAVTIAPPELLEVFRSHLRAMLELPESSADRTIAQMHFRARFCPFAFHEGREARRAYTGGLDQLVLKLRELVPSYMAVLDQAYANIQKYGVATEQQWRESRWGVASCRATTHFRTERLHDGNMNLEVTFETYPSHPHGILSAIERQWCDQLHGSWTSTVNKKVAISGKFGPANNARAA